MNLNPAWKFTLETDGYARLDENRVIIATVGRIHGIFYRQLNGRVTFLTIALEHVNNETVHFEILRANMCPCGNGPRTSGKTVCMACCKRNQRKSWRQRQRARKTVESAPCTTAS